MMKTRSHSFINSSSSSTSWASCSSLCRISSVTYVSYGDPIRSCYELFMSLVIEICLGVIAVYRPWHIVILTEISGIRSDFPCVFRSSFSVVLFSFTLLALFFLFFYVFFIMIFLFFTIFCIVIILIVFISLIIFFCLAPRLFLFVLFLHIVRFILPTATTCTRMMLVRLVFHTFILMDPRSRGRRIMTPITMLTLAVATADTVQVSLA
ncbi:hypothetical protein CSUI_005497 [Cystoisospora suis]|uniref:Transmembrane protein n=1 Tax=Cystoisospora suis TaxID=483139 RepID=A0A2C6KXE0_9APIC|nr:hypothetical protein CSUI_005497 [Cystoisospora suis]